MHKNPDVEYNVKKRVWEVWRVMGYGYYCGRMARLEDITLPLSDRSIFFADAIYDAAVGYGGKIFLENEHIERFISNARALGISNIPSADELSRRLRDLIAFSGYLEYFLYFQLSATSDSRTHARGSSGSALLITITEYCPPQRDKQLRLISYPDRRYSLCNIKTVNLLPAVLASTAAENAGADEAVFIRNGIVTECAHSNISILRGGRLVTHPTCDRILPGITRARLIHFAKELSIPVEERGFTKEELLLADEVLVTSTTKFSLSAKSVDGVAVGGKARKLACELGSCLFSEYLAFCGQKTAKDC